MKKLINEEFKRMQLLAGLITESQLNEKMEYDDFEQMIKPFLDLAKSKGWIWNSSGDSWFDVSSPAIALYHSTELPTTADEEYKGQKMLASKDVTIGNQVQGFGGNLKNKQGDVIMQSDMNSDQAYFQSKDKAILDAIKASMVNVTDVIQDTKEQSSQLTSAKSFEPVKYYSMLLRKKQAPTSESIDLEEVEDIALRYSNTAPNTPPGATAGTAPSTNKESKAPIYNVTTMDSKTVVGTHQYGIGFKANEVGKKMGFKDHPTSIPNKTKIDRTDNIEQSVNEALRKYRKNK